MTSKRIRHVRPLIIVLGVLMVLGATTVLVSAQTSGDVDLSWSTVDGGGGASAGGAFRLVGTAGQPDAGTMSGGDFKVKGGFWGAVRIRYHVYIPVALRDYP
jgi:hypothetical protein